LLLPPPKLRVGALNERLEDEDEDEDEPEEKPPERLGEKVLLGALFLLPEKSRLEPKLSPLELFPNPPRPTVVRVLLSFPLLIPPPNERLPPKRLFWF
jgi:hypothetical protein